MISYPWKPFPGSPHHWALREVRRLPRGPLKLLDVGAGEGHVLRALSAARDDVQESWAVEPHWAVEAAPRERWVSDLREVEPEDFDLALALGVLEHVPDPAVLLRQIALRLRPGGTLLVSVPNVAHWSVRLGLLAGRFEYGERGILDRTHLRFFTRRSVLRLIRGAGLEVEQSGAALAPLELLLPGPVSESRPWSLLVRARARLARAVPGLFGYQMLVRARKP